ncbi:hypothetical protein AVEN_170862-1 [Araneus ventricosus]|uniref:Uncharacterized protein n=1 Tax=Araneus ventricosus TaxID=182803 RepID=A0A4Y2T4I5_ARAVE|nr:hypothetical protein AVEN_170862-1 [Araneus ventricosus]
MFDKDPITRHHVWIRTYNRQIYLIQNHTDNWYLQSNTRHHVSDKKLSLDKYLCLDKKPSLDTMFDKNPSLDTMFDKNPSLDNIFDKNPSLDTIFGKNSSLDIMFDRN